MDGIDKLIDWSAVVKLLDRIYGSDEGRPSYPLLTYVKLLLLQQWYGLSDPGLEEALAFYGCLFDFELRGKSETSAFIDLGDQFLALQKGRTQSTADGRHSGLVVDDKEAVRKALADAGIEPLPGPFLDFLDPWGNRIEIVGYDNIQFTKVPNVLRGMGLAHLSKNETAIKELAAKGMAPA